MSARLAVLAFVSGLVLSLAALGVGAYELSHKAQDTAKGAEEIRQAAIENCEVNGNPLREAVQKLIAEQIRNADSPVVKEIFPQIPPALLRLHVAADRRRLAEIAPVDCSAQYPKP